MSAASDPVGQETTVHDGGKERRSPAETLQHDATNQQVSSDARVIVLLYLPKKHFLFFGSPAFVFVFVLQAEELIVDSRVKRIWNKNKSGKEDAG